MFPTMNDVASNVWRPYRVPRIESRGGAVDVVPTRHEFATITVAAQDVFAKAYERSQVALAVRALSHRGQRLDTFSLNLHVELLTVAGPLRLSRRELEFPLPRFVQLHDLTGAVPPPHGVPAVPAMPASPASGGARAGIGHDFEHQADRRGELVVGLHDFDVEGARLLRGLRIALGDDDEEGGVLLHFVGLISRQSLRRRGGR